MFFLLNCNSSWHNESVLRTHPANPLQNHHIFAVPYFIKKFTKQHLGNCTGLLIDVLLRSWMLHSHPIFFHNVSISAWIFLRPQWVMRQRCGVDCLVLPAVKTVVMGSTSLYCEPGGTHSSVEWFSGVQQCPCKCLRHPGSYFMKDYTKEAA